MGNARRHTGRDDGGPVFNFRTGRGLEGRYVLGECIGYGFEGEVYRLRETATKIDLVVKFYYPDVLDPRRSVTVARRLHRLRHCDIVLQYHHHGEITWRRQRVPYMVSELAQGRILYELLAEKPNQRFDPFEALHVIAAITAGVAEIHALGLYHGDIHGDNVLLEQVGINYRPKLIDPFTAPQASKARRLKGDVVDLAYLLYELVGGPKGYPQSPRLVKEIVCGRRVDTICRKFPSARRLRDFIATYGW